MPTHATLQIDGKTLELPVVVGTEREVGIDIAALRKETGAVTLDPGFMNTGSCRSAITFIDGDRGILRYRGYPIEELADKSTFLEAAWLLLRGELPAAHEHEAFVSEIRRHTMLHEDLKRFFSVFPKQAHPMAVCSATIGALSTFYPDLLDHRNPEQVRGATLRLIAKLPTIAAYSFKHSLGQPFMYPRNDLDYAGNFLHMMFANPCEDYQVDPVVARALDVLLILHADHEQNCSTSTVRVVGSSDANLFGAISAGVMALWGPLHGGANQAVIEMLQQIRKSGENPRTFMDKVKDKASGRRLMGFGHRVYKNYDPRAKIIKRACSEVLQKMKVANPLLDIAVQLEEVALKDPYFVERKLYPNVDFYSGIIYQAMGIPLEMFTVLFAMGRLPGWIAHWSEMHGDPATKIARPRQIYTGHPQRAYLPMAERPSAAAAK
jgi:citrate synthase